MISQECSLGDPLPKLLKPFLSVEQDGGQSCKNRKTFSWLLLLNQYIDFKKNIQECSLGDCPPKLLKPFRSVEQDGRQGYK